MGRRSRMVIRVLHRVSVPLAVAALVAIAGLSLGRVYNGTLLTSLVAGAAAGSVLVSVMLRRAPAWLVAPVSVLLLLAYAVLAVNVSAQSGGVTGDLRTLVVDAARNAVPRLLTALIPVEPQPDTVLAPVVLAWLAGFAGAELAARARRGALALMPPTLLYTGALILVGPNAPATLWQPLLFAAIAAAGLAAGNATSGARTLPGLDAGQRTVLRLRAGTGLAVGLLTVVAAVALIAPLVARLVGGAPTDPRTYVAPPSLDVLDQNPLIRISGWAANPEQHLFDVAVLGGSSSSTTPAPSSLEAPPTSSAPTPSADPSVVAVEPEDPPAPADNEPSGPVGAHDTRLRLAILSDWDGVTWHVDADYRNAGRVLPPVPPPPGHATVEGSADLAPPLTIEERITVADLEGRLMPAVSAPHRVDGVRVAYDQSTGSLLHASPLAPGVTYTVTSVSPTIDVNLLPASDVPSGTAVARYLAVGGTVPPDLTQLAQQVSTGESSPYMRALVLEAFLAEHYQYAADAPSGHAYPNLRFFLFEDPRAGGRRGTSEQFASAFAALGRLMGLPTRVVVGFQTPAGGGPITAADALAWPEVLFSGIGWVGFDPIPDGDVPPRPLEDEFLPKPPPPTSPPASVEPPAAPTWTAPPPTAPVHVAPPAGPGAAVIAGGVGGGLVTALLLLTALVVVLRAVRTRRRFRGAPPRQVLGAWDEVLDALLLAGAPPPPHLAAAEVASHAARVADGAGPSHRPRPAVPDLRDLAVKVNAVGFAGDTTPGPDELAAIGARAQAGEYGRALRARRSWWRRVLWRIDPRPLFRRSR